MDVPVEGPQQPSDPVELFVEPREFGRKSLKENHLRLKSFGWKYLQRHNSVSH